MRRGVKMEAAEIKIKGKTVRVPSARIDGKTVVVRGKWFMMAAVQDEEWLSGEVDEPAFFVEQIKQKRMKADVFTFCQKLPHIEPEHPYYMEWDNVAAIPVTTFQEWWEKRLPQVTRKSIRRGFKRDVVASVCEFNDDLVHGIIEIH